MSRPVDAELLKHFAAFRDYIEHEDDLINHRSSWHHTTQGFLFAALGATLVAKPDPATLPQLVVLQKTMVFILPLLGMWLSFVTAVSIRSAAMVVYELTNQWRTIVDGYGSDIWPPLPGLTGAGLSSVSKWGKLSAFGIPRVVGGVWLLLLLVEAITLLMVHFVSCGSR